MSKLRVIIKDLELLRRELLGDKQDVKDPNRSDFDNLKLDITRDLDTLKKSIATQREYEKNGSTDRDREIIELRSKHTKQTTEIKEKLSKMKTMIEKEDKKHNKSKDESILEALVNKKKLFVILANELKQVSEATKHSSVRDMAHVARTLEERREERREKRRRDREERRQRRGENNDNIVDAIEMTDRPIASEQEMAFQKEVTVNLEEQDAILDEIYKQVNILGEMSKDINTVIKVQNNMIDELDNKMDNTNNNFKTANSRLKEILEESGGMSRWCPMIICIIILLAVVGYIYSTVKKN